MKLDSCELCRGGGGRLVIATDSLRVVLVDEPDYPGYVRVIWDDHVCELTDLSPPQREKMMAAVYAVEGAVRATMAPQKVNVASLGNMTPHLHWHVIARHADDPHYPSSVWSLPQREHDAKATAERRSWVPALELAIAAAFVDLD